MYAYKIEYIHIFNSGGYMATKKVRKSYFVDTDMVKKAMKLLGTNSEAEAIRISVQRTVEMATFWKFMDRTSHSLKKGSFS